jgi:hypothetical protein
MCEVRSRKNGQEPKKKKYSGQQQKEMDWYEPHPVPNEKMQPIQWTERPTGALVAAGSLWPEKRPTFLTSKRFSFAALWRKEPRSILEGSLD